nr:HECT-like protein [Tanacetum cinerariifolium]
WDWGTKACGVCGIGRVIALALMHNTQVGIVFGRAFFLQLARINVYLEDIKDADLFLYSNCKQIQEMDPCVVDQDVLGLTFTWEVEELGVKKVVELCPEGNNINIVGNEKNMKLFPKSLELEDLDGMLYGSESEISVDD